jgi:hypothetical protein
VGTASVSQAQAINGSRGGKAMTAWTVLRRIECEFGKARLRQVAGTHSGIAAGGTVSAVGWVLHVSSAAFAGFGGTGGA